MTGLDRLDSRATWLLSQANVRAHAMLNQSFGAHGVRGYHYRILAALDQHGPSSQADLGRYARLDRSDVNTALGELLAERLAKRTPDPVDRRRNVVTITAKGRAKLAELDRVVDDVQRAVLDPLTERERRQLVALLTKLAPPSG